MCQYIEAATRPVAALALLGLLAACSKQPETTNGPPSGTAAATAPVDAAPKVVVAANVQAMRIDDLRAAANKALSQNRIYAPGGNNAMEYYLALRDKQPDNPATTSALTDLMPYTVIAAEQSITRKDFEEAERLQALIAKADPKAPALPRLGQAIDRGEKLLAQQTSEETSKATAEVKIKAAQRLAEQAAQQKQVTDALAVQQSQVRAETARAEAARSSATGAAQAVASEPAASIPVAEAPEPRPVAPAAAGSSERRLLSAPPPRYPMDALRSSTGGQVVVEITIGGDGDVTNVRVVEASPPRVFDRAALMAVKRWKFEPTGSVSTTRRTIAFNPG